MTLPTVVGGVPQAGVANNGNDITLDVSGIGLQLNDVLYVFQFRPRTTDTLGPTQTGYAELARVVNESSASNPVLASYAKRMSSSPDTTITLPGGGGTANANVGIVLPLRGVATDVFLDVPYVSSESIDPPAITTITNDALIVSAVTSNVNDTSVTSLAGYDNFIRANQSESRSITAALCTKGMPIAGTENPPEYSDLSIGAIPQAITLAIRPASGSTPPTNSGRFFAFM